MQYRLKLRWQYLRLLFLFQVGFGAAMVPSRQQHEHDQLLLRHELCPAPSEHDAPTDDPRTRDSDDTATTTSFSNKTTKQSTTTRSKTSPSASDTITYDRRFDLSKLGTRNQNIFPKIDAVRSGFMKDGSLNSYPDAGADHCWSVTREDDTSNKCPVSDKRSHLHHNDVTDKNFHDESDNSSDCDINNNVYVSNNRYTKDNISSVLGSLGIKINITHSSASVDTDPIIDDNNNDFYSLDKNRSAIAQRKRTLIASSKNFFKNSFTTTLLLMLLIAITTSSLGFQSPVFAAAAASRPPYLGVPVLHQQRPTPLYRIQSHGTPPQVFHRSPFPMTVSTRSGRLILPQGVHPTSLMHFDGLQSVPAQVSQSLTLPPTPSVISTISDSSSTLLTPPPLATFHSEENANDASLYSSSVEASNSNGYDFVNTIHPNDTLTAQEFSNILRRYVIYM